MRTFLFSLVAIVALAALVAGLLLVFRPDGSLLGLSESLLKSTPFTSFLLPGLLLAVVIGGVNLVAVLFGLSHKKAAYVWASTGGILLCAGLIDQMLVTQVYHLLSLLLLAAGFAIVFLSYALMGNKQ
ncbi:hypothetical protein V9K67_16930 [Paraflavisolibacter sp. H34]|uniref:hypothetical protein n=1 Tax=Huijunlia imazamoxiresistens TaxID=3127457 RepID=UPI003015F804